MQPSRGVGDVLDVAIRWLTAYTYAVVLIAALIDATGVPFPGRIVLAAAGALAASADDLSVLLLIALSATGIIITDHLWYFAGALGVDRLLLRGYCRLTGETPDCVERARRWLTRFGPLVIVAGRFVAAVRMLAWPLARGHGVGYPTFLAFDIPAALVWCATWVGLGWLLGEQWADASAEMRWIGLGMAGSVVLAGAVIALWRRRRRTAVSSPAAPAPRESGAPASRGWPGCPRARRRP